MSYHDLLRTDALSLEVEEVLRSSPTLLLGVSAGAAETLAQLGIRTVFDLARSATFAAASEVAAAATDTASPDARVGSLPGDLFATTSSVTIVDAPRLGVDALRLVSQAGLSTALAQALDVRTIRDLAMWPPFVAAKEVLAQATEDQAVGADEVPGDLLPMSGRYPTERAHYSTFVLADLDDPTGTDRVALEDAGPLDPLAAVAGTGFSRPVRGARLTFVQSWYSQGVALGQLLHSLALAPGESTRVAMIDWSRQQTGTQAETGAQTEQLAADMTHKRAMSEVQDAVAREAQNGFSQTDASATQLQSGGGGGVSLGPFTAGASVAYGSSTSHGSTVTGTSGVRSISADMAQDVADTTHQAASSARTMFASVVRELSQSEHEAVSTRVVANYNHMHALTVQYYEVVQIFRTTVQLNRFEPCLFVPMKTIDFLASAVNGSEAPGPLVVRRYRAALQAAALDARTRSMLDADVAGVVGIEARPTVQLALNAHPAPPPPDPGPDGATAPAASGAPLTGPGSRSATVDLGNTATVTIPDGATLQTVRASFPCRMGGLLFPAGASVGMQYLALQPNVGNEGQPFASDLRIPVPLADVTSLLLDTAGIQFTGFVTLVLGYRGSSMEVAVPVVAYGSGPSEQVMTFRRNDPVQTLLSALAEDPLHYSQAVWRAMDSATVALLLAPYSYAGKPLAQTVDTSAIGTSGNFLIFRMPGEARDLLDPAAPPSTLGSDEAWTAWVRRHANYETVIEDFVPLPSGGVFGEAVLGRANSAEKLDITRFWNWQDSPIPLTAPDISPVTTGSRARDDTTTPSGLAAPVVAFNAPTALPDPAGIAATLGALASGGMFRDNSGADTTQALALAALTGAGTGAAAAGDRSQAYAALATQKEIEMAKLAAGLVTGGLGGAGGSGASTVSEKGATINEGRSLDERAAGKGEAGGTEHEARAAEGESAAAVGILDKLSSRSTTPTPTPTPSPGTGDTPSPEQPLSPAGSSSAPPDPKRPGGDAEAPPGP